MCCLCASGSAAGTTDGAAGAALLCSMTSMLCRTLQCTYQLVQISSANASFYALHYRRIIFLFACCVCCIALSVRLSCIVDRLCAQHWQTHAVMYSSCFVCEASLCVQLCLAVLLCVFVVHSPCVLHARYVYWLHISSVYCVQLWWVVGFALRKLLILFAFCRKGNK